MYLIIQPHEIRIDKRLRKRPYLLQMSQIC